ncbi:MAG: hypothetical protein Kow0058_09230 [Roseovarius sp.]
MTAHAHQQHGPCADTVADAPPAVPPRPSRRDILRAALGHGGSAPVLRPPGAQTDFARLCDDCGACARACPQRIVRRAPAGGPMLDFARGGCIFCGECARACPTGALRAEPAQAWPWRAVIAQGCLSLGGISCRACEDACTPRAIGFRLAAGGRAIPVLAAARCTGCGECASVCPAGAVSFARVAPGQTADAAAPPADPEGRPGRQARPLRDTEDLREIAP